MEISLTVAPLGIEISAPSSVLPFWYRAMYSVLPSLNWYMCLDTPFAETSSTSMSANGVKGVKNIMKTSRKGFKKLDLSVLKFLPPLFVYSRTVRIIFLTCLTGVITQW